MGKIINRYVKSVISQTVEGNVIYKNPGGYVRIEEDDDDPLHKVNLVICAILSVKAKNVDTAQYNRYTTCSISSNEYSDSIISLTGTCVSADYTDVSARKTVHTFTRGNEPVSYSGTMTVTSPFGEIWTTAYSFNIPPLKQNATKNGARITCTSGGVKYDLLNYK